MKVSTIHRKARKVFAAHGHSVGRFSLRDFDKVWVGWCSECHRPAFVNQDGVPFGGILSKPCEPIEVN